MNVIVDRHAEIILTLGIANLILGGFFLFWSNALMRANKTLNKWVSMHRFEEALNASWDFDGRIMGMRKILGFVCLALGFLFVLFYTR
jgi:uncharacterized membrane protein YbaN (DUF454 family)